MQIPNDARELADGAVKVDIEYLPIVTVALHQVFDDNWFSISLDDATVDDDVRRARLLTRSLQLLA